MKLIFCCLLCVASSVVLAQEPDNLKITILSTMLADTQGKGEWGFSALVEVDSVKILFDTGKHPDLVLENSKALRVSLTDIQDLILSHNHLDHTGGAERLRQELPSSFSKVYVGRSFFLPKMVDGKVAMKSFDSTAYVKSGGVLQVVSSFVETRPGIYLTGPIPRKHGEENYPKTTMVKTSHGLKVDIVEEDMSLVVSTTKGLVLLSGCGHAGIVNTLDYVKQNFPGKKVIAAIGGFHLLETEESKVVWTAQQLQNSGVQYFIGAHCTGLNSVYKIREVTRLPAAQCLIGSVGTVFDLNKGVRTGWMK